MNATPHRANVRCADGMVHDVRVCRTSAAACGVVVLDLPPGVGPRFLGHWARTQVIGTGPTVEDPVDCMACIAAHKTPYAVLCDDHGQRFLTEEQYSHQLNRPNALWACPACGRPAHWDDDEYEAASAFEGPDTEEDL